MYDYLPRITANVPMSDPDSKHVPAYCNESSRGHSRGRQKVRNAAEAASRKRKAQKAARKLQRGRR